MESKVILGIILLSLSIVLSIFIFRKQKKSIHLFSYQFKYIGFFFLASAIVLLLLTGEDYTGLFLYTGILGGLIVALSRERKETKIDYATVRKSAIFSTLRNLLPLIIVIGILHITFSEKEANLKDVTVYTPSTIFLFIIGYLIVFYSRKNKAVEK
ncbi:MAG: hypothetical protein ACLFM7_09220 [Bacteroidales bacterium]